MKFEPIATLLGCILLALGGMFVVSTFDTHNWNSLIFGTFLGIIGAILNLYVLWRGEPA